MKTRFALLVTPFLLLYALACSDNPAASKIAVPRGSFAITPQGSLDYNIMTILALLPKGLETAATTRWGNVKAKYALGLTDPAQMAVAKQMLFELSAWVKMKGPDMDTPPAGESKTSAAARAVLYMAMYVYGGPLTPPPDYFNGADAVVGLVTPGAAATVVTPSTHAGVQFEAGSVAQNTIVVISQNPNAYPLNCSGPLTTQLCQYPQFYKFDQFPHVKLLKGAKFAVCHVNFGDLRNPPEGIHDRFRLAHTLPTSETDYTPGSIIRNSEGESIEILPFITQTFAHCEENAYVPPEVEQITAIDALKGLARRMVAFVSPKTAYAIDQGGGGVSFFFSDFNVVDPVNTDLGTLPGDISSWGLAINDAGQAVGVSESGSAQRAFLWSNNTMTALGSLGGNNSAGQAINNSGTVAGYTQLPTGQFRAARWSNGTLDTLGTLGGTNSSVATGINSAGQIVGYSYVTGTTNQLRGWIWQNGVFTELRPLEGGTFVSPTGINDAGTVVGWGDSNQGTRGWRWQGGTMTMLGTLGGGTFAYAINSSGSVAGSSCGEGCAASHAALLDGNVVDLGVFSGDANSVAEGINSGGQVVGLSWGSNYHAVLWQNGQIINLGTLGGDFGEAKGINVSGQIVGQSKNAAGKTHATIWQAPAPVSPE
jgi:probable HAF family extracellular repeat protein